MQTISFSMDSGGIAHAQNATLSEWVHSTTKLPCIACILHYIHIYLTAISWFYFYNLKSNYLLMNWLIDSYPGISLTNLRNWWSRTPSWAWTRTELRANPSTTSSGAGTKSVSSSSSVARSSRLCPFVRESAPPVSASQRWSSPSPCSLRVR